jgi:hypothetical protein
MRLAFNHRPHFALLASCPYRLDRRTKEAVRLNCCEERNSISHSLPKTLCLGATDLRKVGQTRLFGQSFVLY